MINKKEFLYDQTKLDGNLICELKRIGETEIKAREYYLKKYGYYGRPELRNDYNIQNVLDVDVVISPNKSARNE